MKLIPVIFFIKSYIATKHTTGIVIGENINASLFVLFEVQSIQYPRSFQLFFLNKLIKTYPIPIEKRLTRYSVVFVKQK